MGIYFNQKVALGSITRTTRDHFNHKVAIHTQGGPGRPGVVPDGEARRAG